MGGNQTTASNDINIAGSSASRKQVADELASYSDYDLQQLCHEYHHLRVRMITPRAMDGLTEIYLRAEILWYR